MYCPSFPDAPTIQTFFAPGDPGIRTSPSTCRPWGRSLLVVSAVALVIVLLLLGSAEVGDIGAPRSCTRSIATARYARIDTKVLFGVLFGECWRFLARVEVRKLWLQESLADSGWDQLCGHTGVAATTGPTRGHVLSPRCDFGLAVCRRCADCALSPCPERGRGSR